MLYKPGQIILDKYRIEALVGRGCRPRIGPRIHKCAWSDSRIREHSWMA